MDTTNVAYIFAFVGKKQTPQYAKAWKSTRRGIPEEFLIVTENSLLGIQIAGYVERKQLENCVTRQKSVVSTQSEVILAGRETSG